MAASVLVVDDDESVATAHARVLSRRGYETFMASDGAEALAVVARETVAAIVSDLSMPGMGGLELLRHLREEGNPVPVIVVSGKGTIQTALELIRAGAVDFLEKPVQAARLLVTLENALRYDRLRREHSELRQAADAQRKMLGTSALMERLRALICKVAPSEGRVLILGDNGTGKELVAGAVHAGSTRHTGPFVKLNCAAVPSELVESELFGHEKGAFTGATTVRRGKFELADGGTLFLDEIGDMPAAMQAKLLRVLQDGCFERVGGSRTVEVDVRVLTATNRDLAKMVDEGQFREDLYYRLNVVTVAVPALRDRLEDVPLLARSFLVHATSSKVAGVLRFDDDALAALQRHDYPGNVRELRNLVERLVILADGDTIRRSDVEAQMPGLRSRPSGDVPGLYREGVSLRELVGRAEGQIMAEALRAHGGNKSATARALGVERSHFFKKLRQRGIGGAEPLGSGGRSTKS